MAPPLCFIASLKYPFLLLFQVDIFREGTFSFIALSVISKRTELQTAYEMWLNYSLKYDSYF